MQTAQTMLPLQVLVLALIFCHGILYVAASTPLSTDEHGDYNGLDLIEWINSHPDGDIHPSLRIGREVPGDPTSMLGLYVKSSSESNEAPTIKPIEKGEVIAQIPWEHMIHPDGKYSKRRMFSCRAIYNLSRELRLGEKSKRAPYVRYLLTQPRGIMPGEWTNAGQEFLSEMLGRGELPPYENMWRNKFDVEWLDGCLGVEDNEIETAAYWLASARDEDSLMVPVYDMANHSNDPELLNTLSYKPDKAGDAFRFVASKKILPGEQIYNSYNRCNQCYDGNQRDCETWSFDRTPELFTHFGFVEDYPQNWSFDPGNSDSSDDDSSDDEETEFEFCIERDAESGEIDALWEDEDEMPDSHDAAWLGMQLKRLKKLQGRKEGLEKKLVQGENNDDEEDSGDDEKMTRWEWESIWRYHQALSRALNAAMQSVVEDSGDEL